MKNALFILEDLSCSGSPISSLHILENLNKNITPFVIILTGKENKDLYFIEKYKEITKKIFILKFPHLYSKKFKIFYFYYCYKIYSFICKISKKHTFNFVYFNRFLITGLLSRKIRKKFNGKIIFHSLGEIQINQKNLLMKIIYKINLSNVIKYVDFLIGIAKKCIPEILSDNIETTILHDYCDLEIKKKNKIFSEKKCVNLGQIGYFIELKNQLYSLQILKELMDKGLKVSLLLIGYPLSNEYYEKMLKYISENNLNSIVTFLNPDFDKEEYFEKIDLLLLPSLSEGSPLVINEALYRKTPCLSSLAVSEESNNGNLYRLDITNKKQWVEFILSESYKKEIKFDSNRFKKQFISQLNDIFSN